MDTKTKERKTVILDGNSLEIEDVINVSLNNYNVVVSEDAVKNVVSAHDAVKKMIKNNVVAYGVTTGFGKLHDIVIKSEEACQLSRNIIVSHSIAVGKPMPIPWVKAGILVRINALIKGYSGVSMDTINAMVGLLHHNIIPVIPDTGSLACSGDLCLLSHMALVISKPIEDTDTADNDVYYQGKIIKGSDAMKLAGLKKVVLGPKEGLGVTNGSTFTAGMACLAYHRVQQLYKQSLASLVLSCEAMLSQKDAFNSQIHKLRNQSGQIEFASSVRAMTRGSKLMNTSGKIQDPYSTRCSSQVQGILCDRINELKDMLNKEINAVTDNPILVENSKNRHRFVSGGNFNGAYIGQYIESIKVALAEIGAMVERRIARLVDNNMSNGLPAMLVENPGLNSGYMIAQYTAAALALKNQKDAFPDSVLSLPTCMNQEDHNSNAYNSVVSLFKIIENTNDIITIETMCCIRGLKLRFKLNDQEPMKVLGKFGKQVYVPMVKLLDPLDTDHSLQQEMKNFRNFINSKEYCTTVDKITDQSNDKIVLNTPKGTIDQTPEDMIIRNQVFDKIKKVLKSHSIDEIETPMFELRSTLLGQYGDASKKLVFDLMDQGGTLCTLRFDLTVPFSRYVAQHNLTKMKRYQVGPVFRRDNPVMSKGRCRQFYQFDLDFAGDFDTMVADSEIIKVMTDVLSSFDIDYKIKFNYKGLLDSILEICQVPTEKLSTVCSSIDKLDKSPWSAIKDELAAKGLDSKVISNIEQHILLKGKPTEVLEKLQIKYAENKSIVTILTEIDTLFNYLKVFECLDKLEFDLSLARGLSYYTGIIMEAVALGKYSSYGSISAGGRYDNLIGKFSNKKIPAVGMSFGIERLLAIVKDQNKQKEFASKKCYVTFIKDRKDNSKNKVLFENVLKIAAQLWKNDIPTEIVDKNNVKMGEQIVSNLNKGTSHIIIVAETELAENKVLVKDLQKKEQQAVPLDKLITHLVALKQE